MGPLVTWTQEEHANSTQRTLLSLGVQIRNLCATS